MSGPPEDWPFDSPRNEAAVTVQAVLDGDPILQVNHDADDGGWQFLDGRPPQMSLARVVGLGKMVERDPSLVELADLPLGWVAWRTDARSPWRRRRSG